MDKKKENISKEAIVAEYLTGAITYSALEAKYGVPSRSICDWDIECRVIKQKMYCRKKAQFIHTLLMA